MDVTVSNIVVIIEAKQAFSQNIFFSFFEIKLILKVIRYTSFTLIQVQGCILIFSFEINLSVFLWLSMYSEYMARTPCCLSI